jgi:hypothetical protein
MLWGWFNSCGLLVRTGDWIEARGASRGDRCHSRLAVLWPQCAMVGLSASFG